MYCRDCATAYTYIYKIYSATPHQNLHAIYLQDQLPALTYPGGDGITHVTREMKPLPVLAELEKPRAAACTALAALNLVHAERGASAQRAKVASLPMLAYAVAAAVPALALGSPVNADACAFT